MSCPSCGQQTPRAGRCKQCAIIARYDSNDDQQPDRGSQPVECTQCGAHYRTDDSDKCPECGSHRRRYAGELATDGGTDTGVIEHGDAFETLAQLKDDSGHAAVIDYPWEFNYRNGTGRFGYEHDGGDETEENYYGPMGDDCMFSMESEDRLSELFDELARVLVDGAWVLCFADDVFQDPVREALQANEDLIFRRNWAWEPKVMGMGYYGRVGHYPIPTATVGETDRYVQGRSTLYHIDKEPSVDYPTAKPVSLYRKLLQPPVLRDREHLIEPFCGCGPGAAIASERNIEYWGVDAEERAVSLARDRLNQQTLGDYQAALTDGGDDGV